MAYAAITDFEQRHGGDEVVQRESMLGAGAVDRALADAEAEINSYVSGRYVVPLSPVPITITRLACAIARYHVLGDAATETARRAYEDARAFLRDVQAGRAQLDGANQVSAATGAATVDYVTDERLFSRDAR
ncbi:MAG: DUF1320 domain-containing protein [Candidatus Accumulibacter sp.]|uniref:gp436 family protein n=1 Tax=Accumulibacter sp. TaxID=2053492 RepID=UPI001A423565|nr:DUF1320 domain-containing protein [Accumulibacter sp.]MBL8396175.1 DUF1320 domain-containing protein [Accumulibacter sp.]